MLTTEIKQDTHSGPVTLNPRWLRIPAAVKYSGVSRSRLYELLSERKIRSICLKSHKGAERGVRLLDRESIDTFMLALQSEVDSAAPDLSSFTRRSSFQTTRHCFPSRRTTYAAEPVAKHKMMPRPVSDLLVRLNGLGKVDASKSPDVAPVERR